VPGRRAYGGGGSSRAAADLGLADGDPALDQVAGAFLAAVREEYCFRRLNRRLS